jgi:pimeloyl-ACP methyl ester carboxylesterase
MSQSHQRQLLLGIAVGAVASLFTIWVRRGRATRAGLANRIEEVTLRNVEQLGVAAESRFISVNGLQLHTITAGPRDGKLIVLLHGFPENWGTWRHSIKPLVDAGYRVAVPDQRGYNLSDKPDGIHNYRLDALASDVRELIRSFERDQAIIVGHDWGGSVAWQLAMDYPEVVEKMIIVNAPHPAAFRREIRENPAQQQKSWYMAAFQLPWLPELLLGQSPLASADLFFRKGAVNQEAYSSYDLHGLAVSMSQPGALTAMLNWYRAPLRNWSSSQTRQIDTPTLLIWAEQDVALGKSLTYGLDQWVTDLKIHYIANCGHWAQNEAPDEVNAQILGFL